MLRRERVQTEAGRGRGGGLAGSREMPASMRACGGSGRDHATGRTGKASVVTSAITAQPMTQQAGRLEAWAEREDPSWQGTVSSPTDISEAMRAAGTPGGETERVRWGITAASMTSSASMSCQRPLCPFRLPCGLIALPCIIAS